MAFPSSPGVVVNEIDLTTIVPGVSTAVGALAGVFRWGPIGIRLLVDSEADYAKKLGTPTNFNPETWFTGANFLAYSGAMQVVRGANTSGVSPIVTANVVASNNLVNVGNTANLTNGMILVAASNAAAIKVGTSIVVTNASYISLAAGSDAFGSANSISLQFVSNTTAFNAIANSASVANLTGQIVKSEDHFLTKQENSDFDADVNFIAKWPGALGNSLKVSAVDTADAFSGNIDLTSNGNYDSSISFIVDSSNASITFDVAANAEVFNVNTFNSFVSNTLNSLVIGDYIIAGNSAIGDQAMQISSLPTTVTNVTPGTNTAITVNTSLGSTTLTTTANGFSEEDFNAGDWIVLYSNSSTWYTYKIDTVDDSNTVTLVTAVDFSNTSSVIAPISNTAKISSVRFTDRYKRVENNVRTNLERYWEYSAAFDGAPGQTTTVLTSGNTAANDEMHLVVVDEDGKFTGVPGTILEKFERVSRATDAKNEDGDDNYYKTVINNISEYIWVVNDRSGAATSNATNVQSSSNRVPYSKSFTLGTDGSDENGVSLGVITSAYDQFVSTEDVDVSLIMTGKSRGGVAGGQLANYLIDNLAEPRMDAVVFVSPERSDVINNTGSEATDIVAFRNTLRSTSYAFLDSGYKYMYDRYNDIYRYVPLNGDMAGLAARSEQTNDAWWSFAGLNRGKIRNVVKLAYNPRKTDRDFLYKNSVNPVVTFPGDGTLLYGDKTLLAKPSAFDRINVRRLFIVLEKSIARASKYSLFEFNDAFTRAQFRNLVIPFLRDVQGRRGITDFLVVCDGTNNPPSVIDRNEFVGDIYVKPARSINYVTLNFIATPTGLSFTEAIQ